jgi:hypothetical protein
VSTLHQLGNLAQHVAASEAQAGWHADSKVLDAPWIVLANAAELAHQPHNGATSAVDQLA